MGCRPLPLEGQSWSQDSDQPMSKNPLDLGVDLCIAQLYGEGTTGTIWPWIHPFGHLSPMKELDPVAEKGLQELRAHQPFFQEFPNDLPQGLQPAEVLLSHTIPPVGLGDGAATCEPGEQHISVVPQKEPYFPPLVQRIEVWLNPHVGLAQCHKGHHMQDP
jgi:hypothetical protein